MEPDELTMQAERIAAAFYAAKQLLAPEYGVETHGPAKWEDVPQGKRDLLVMSVRTLLENGLICAGPEASEGALGFTREQLRGNGDSTEGGVPEVTLLLTKALTDAELDALAIVSWRLDNPGQPAPDPEVQRSLLAKASAARAAVKG